MWADLNLKKSVSMTICNMLLPRSQTVWYLSQLMTGTVTLAFLPVCSVMPTVNMVSEPRNREGERILEFATANGLHIGNTWFKKRETHLITYSSDGDSTQINHILYHKSFSRAVSNMKVIPNKECIKQHHMLVWVHRSHPPCEEAVFSCSGELHSEPL